MWIYSDKISAILESVSSDLIWRLYIHVCLEGWSVSGGKGGGGGELKWYKFYCFR